MSIQELLAEPGPYVCLLVRCTMADILQAGEQICREGRCFHSQSVPQSNLPINPLTLALTLRPRGLSADPGTNCWPGDQSPSGFYIPRGACLDYPQPVVTPGQSKLSTPPSPQKVEKNGIVSHKAVALGGDVQKSSIYQGVLEIGAGDGNRTHVASLEGWSSTIELHPHRRKG